jgi:hypothetical protein
MVYLEGSPDRIFYPNSHDIDVPHFENPRFDLALNFQSEITQGLATKAQLHPERWKQLPHARNDCHNNSPGASQ